MKKTTLVLLLAAVTAMPVMAQDKSGFALTGGMLSYDSKVGKAIEKEGGSDTVFQLGADYTFTKGFILGATSTAMQDVDGTKFGSASFIGGYELDCGVRLKAGLGLTVLDSDYESRVDSGYTLGLGYVFDNGIIVEGAYTDIEIEGTQYGNTVIAVGYKF